MKISLPGESRRVSRLRFFGAKKMSGPNETYDVTATERKVLLSRAARRDKLRHQYLEQIGNPYRMATGEGGSVFDSGVQRFISMKATEGQFFKPTPKNAIMYVSVVILPIAFAMYVIIGSKNKEEHRLRTGQVSYRDREFKWQ